MGNITQDSFLRTRLQQFVASMLFPSGEGDWYAKKYSAVGAKSKVVDPFESFKTEQTTKTNARYYNYLKDVNISLSMIPSQLSNGSNCQLESFECVPKLGEELALPGTGKHIIYFPGANTYYQACFRDIFTAANETGATIHAFNFPGTGRSTGRVKEANDLTNAGLAMVKSLLAKGVHPDNIILQGDCFGAAIVMEVKDQLEKQANVKVRIIMNNAFQSFKAVIIDMIHSSAWIPNVLQHIVKSLLEFTGWHVKPGKKYKCSGPYQCHIQHLGDETLKSSTLSNKVHRMVSSTKKKYEGLDTCPEDYKIERDKLDAKHILRVRSDANKRLESKFGKDQYNRINAHFADLCEMETLDGKPAYANFVNTFIDSSNHYITQHPQNHSDLTALSKKIHFIDKRNSKAITRAEAATMVELSKLVSDNPNNQQENSPRKYEA